MYRKTIDAKVTHELFSTYHAISKCLHERTGTRMATNHSGTKNFRSTAVLPKCYTNVGSIRCTDYRQADVRTLQAPTPLLTNSLRAPPHYTATNTSLAIHKITQEYTRNTHTTLSVV